MFLTQMWRGCLEQSWQFLFSMFPGLFVKVLEFSGRFPAGGGLWGQQGGLQRVQPLRRQEMSVAVFHWERLKKQGKSRYNSISRSENTTMGILQEHVMLPSRFFLFYIIYASYINQLDHVEKLSHAEGERIRIGCFISCMRVPAVSPISLPHFMHISPAHESFLGYWSYGKHFKCFFLLNIHFVSWILINFYSPASACFKLHVLKTRIETINHCPELKFH